METTIGDYTHDLPQFAIKQRSTTMKRTAIAAVSLIAGLSACGQDASKADIGQPDIVGEVQPSIYVQKAPDKVTIFNNFDQHPTVVQLCIDGIAFMSVSAKYSGLGQPNITRVEEWDSACGN